MQAAHLHLIADGLHVGGPRDGLAALVVVQQLLLEVPDGRQQRLSLHRSREVRSPADGDHSVNDSSRQG